jgi:hypothetical protein
MSTSILGHERFLIITLIYSSFYLLSVAANFLLGFPGGLDAARHSFGGGHQRRPGRALGRGQMQASAHFERPLGPRWDPRLELAHVGVGLARPKHFSEGRARARARRGEKSGPQARSVRPEMVL